ncbi:hypothetical protein KIPB_015756, partial [Kipferlia bialata]|eukprot:g15756.t1
MVELLLRWYDLLKRHIVYIGTLIVVVLTWYDLLKSMLETVLQDIHSMLETVLQEDIHRGLGNSLEDMPSEGSESSDDDELNAYILY